MKEVCILIMNSGRCKLWYSENTRGSWLLSHVAVLDSWVVLACCCTNEIIQSSKSWHNWKNVFAQYWFICVCVCLQTCSGIAKLICWLRVVNTVICPSNDVIGCWLFSSCGSSKRCYQQTTGAISVSNQHKERKQIEQQLHLLVCCLASCHYFN